MSVPPVLTENCALKRYIRRELASEILHLIEHSFYGIKTLRDYLRVKKLIKTAAKIRDFKKGNR